MKKVSLIAAVACFMLIVCSKNGPTGGGAGSSSIESSSQSITAASGGTITLTDGSSVTFPAGFFADDRMVTLSLLTAMPQQPPCGAVKGVGTCLEVTLSAVPTSTSSRKANALAKAAAGEADFTIQYGNGTIANLNGSLPVVDLVDSAGKHTFAGIAGALSSAANARSAVLRVKAELFANTNRIIVGMANLVPSLVGTSASPAPRIWNGAGWVPYPQGFDPAKKTLLVTHGIFSNVDSAYPCVAKIMKAGGYEQAIGFNYDWTQDEATTGASLATFLDGLKAAGLSHIDIEAHSYGGLTVLSGASRSALQINNIVLEGSPISGTPAAAVANGIVLPWLTVFMNMSLPGGFFPAGAGTLEAVGAGGFLRSLTTGNTARITGLVAAHPETRFIRIAGALDSGKASRANKLVFNGAANDGVVPASSLSEPALPGPPTKTFALEHTALECDSNVVKAVGAMLSANYTGTFTGRSTLTASCGEIPYADESFQLTPTFTVAMAVTGSGTAIDPYTGSMTVSGRLGELTQLSCNCQDCDGELADMDVPFSGSGTVSGSHGTVEAVASVPLGPLAATAVFTGGTINGGTLSGRFTFSWQSSWTPIENAIVLKRN